MQDISILIVEDDRVTAEMLKKILFSAGYNTIHSVITGEEAVEAAGTLQPGLILMDIFLDGELDGITASKAIQRFLDCPVIFITSSTDCETVDKAIETDPYGYIVKPFVKRDISNTIKMALNKHALEKRIRKSEALYKGIVEQLPLHIFRITPVTGTLSYANLNFIKFFLNNDPSGIGRSYPEALSPQLAETVTRSLSEITPDTPIVRHELKSGDSARPIWHRWIFHGIYDETSRMIEIQCIGENITSEKNLQKEIVRASEREMQQIGSDLHDKLGQKLTYISFLAQILKKNLTAQGFKNGDEADEIASLVEDSFTHIRRIYKGLIPVTIEPEGFIYALSEFASATRKSLGREIDLSIAGEVVVNDSLTATNLYYIAHEAINNAVKHSYGGAINILIDASNGNLLIRVENSISADNKSRPANQGMGLEIMRYRADLIGAKLNHGADSGIFFVEIRLGDN